MIKKYRKKPVVIEAMQLDVGNVNAVFEWLNSSNPIGEAYIDYKELHIVTLEGVLIVSHGDWIIRGIKGEFYPCKPDIFALTYEEVIDKREGEDNGRD